MAIKLFVRCGLLTGSLFLAACGATPSRKAPPPGAETVAPVLQPVLHVGQTWGYRRTDLWRNEVIERYEQELRIQDGDRWTVQWRITDSDDPLRRGSVTGEYLDGRTLAFADARMAGKHVPLSFPLQVGKRWSFAYRYIPEQHREVSVEQTAVVVGWEEVNVPVGRFRALKVMHEGCYRARFCSQSMDEG